MVLRKMDKILIDKLFTQLFLAYLLLQIMLGVTGSNNCSWYYKNYEQ